MAGIVESSLSTTSGFGCHLGGGGGFRCKSEKALIEDGSDFAVINNDNHQSEDSIKVEPEFLFDPLDIKPPVQGFDQAMASPVLQHHQSLLTTSEFATTAVHDLVDQVNGVAIPNIFTTSGSGCHLNGGADIHCKTEMAGIEGVFGLPSNNDVDKRTEDNIKVEPKFLLDPLDVKPHVQGFNQAMASPAPLLTPATTEFAKLGEYLVKKYLKSTNISKLRLLRLTAQERNEGIFGGHLDEVEVETLGSLVCDAPVSDVNDVEQHTIREIKENKPVFLFENKSQTIGTQTQIEKSVKSIEKDPLDLSFVKQSDPLNSSFFKQSKENLTKGSPDMQYCSKLLNCYTTKEKEIFNCNECNFQCFNIIDLEKHIYEHGKIPENGIDQYVKDSFTCEYCQIRYSSRYLRNKHLNQIHRREHFNCKYCDTIFSSKQTMVKHMKDNHIGNYEKYICSLCNFQCNISSKILINNHKYKHNFSKTIVFYQTKEHDLYAKPKINIEKENACPVCGVKLALKDSMKKHLLVHSGERPFRCLECGKMFSQKVHLKTHSAIHTQEKPFGCNKCDYRSINISLIRRHMISHSNDRPFNCIICTSSFKRRHKLIEHIKKFH